LGLGALFFVMIHHITKSGWSVTVRRTAEFLMSGLPVFIILVVPILLPGTMTKLFPWVDPQAHHAEGEQAEHAKPEHGAGHGEHTGDQAGMQEGPAHRDGTALEPWAHRVPGYVGTPVDPKLLAEAKAEEHAHALHGKAPYLNKTFFYIRAVLYVLIWAWLSMRFFRWSVDQDTSKDKSKTFALTRSAQEFAPRGLMLFALSITFAAFDWLMSLNPMWYSTIFGVTIFAGACVAIMSSLVLFTMLLNRSGLLKGAVNTEHYHDMGKLLFGWLVFWAYVSFAQFFLIWYGNIPEELAYFHLRWNDNGGTWRNMGLAIILVHFAVPFWLLMSRNVKRRNAPLALGATILFVMHFVEMYWIVLPNFGPLQFHWLDVTCLLGVGGLFFALVLRQMEAHALIPVGDPRLVRALEFENA
jgi:hypothetical protein